MSTCAASERKFLSHDEFGLVEPTHYPKLAEHDAEALREARAKLRAMRDKSRTISRHKRREAIGKAPARAAGASGDAEHAARRKQIFSQALKRTNRQLQRLEHAEARARTVSGQQRALAMVRRAESARRRPNAGQTPSHGMHANPSLRRAMGVNPAKVGSVSKATKVAQAKRDAK